MKSSLLKKLNNTSNPKRYISRIIRKGYGVNTGVYTAIDSSIKMRMDIYGEYQPVFKDGISKESYRKLLAVDMMSDFSLNEDELAENLFKGYEGIKYDSVLGYYIDLYAGFVETGDYRKRGSSGGLTSWILVELMKRKLIDGVIHMHPVDPSLNDGKLFKYIVSGTVKSVREGAKSRYYPGELSEVLGIIADNPEKKYAIVGIPEFITEIRLLATVDERVKRQIAFTVGLVCGHQKSAKYAEALAWQHGIKPGDLQSIDFRVKQPGSTATDYLHRFSGMKDGKQITITKTHSELFGEVWAYGFFKTKFSDFTDNVFNETADIVLGDAWLPEYRLDGMGNNIAIIRNPIIGDIFKEGIKKGDLSLDTVDVETIKKSQQGLIHHGRDELSYRIRKHSRGWYPRKRFDNGVKIPRVRRSIQDLRYKMARKSRVKYQEALNKDDWSVFQSSMSRFINIYDDLYKNMRHETSVATAIQNGVDRIRIKLRIRTRLRNLKKKTRIRTRVVEGIKRYRETHDIKMMDRAVQKATGATLTLTGYFNYGNILQRFALQEFLRKHQQQFVSYAQESLDTHGPEFDRFRNTIEFVKRRIPRKTLDVDDSYDAYIVGSDQVWRKWDATDIEDSYASVRYYFFDFLQDSKAKRIAYSASFGQNDIQDAQLTEDFMTSIKPLVDKIDSISMREKRGIEIVKEWWNRNAQLTVDPTLLLAKKDYDKLIRRSTCDLVPSKEMFAYIIGRQDLRQSHVERIAQSHGLSHSAIYLKSEITLPPIEQWLKNIRDAQLVVTDSFHGVVFCLLNNTSFVVLENKFGGLSRMESLLGDLGLKDRLISEDSIETYNPELLKPIRWPEVNEKIQQARKDSSRWLIEALSVRKG